MRTRRDPSARVLGPLFIAAGMLHFIKPQPYETIVPPYVPRPREVVAISGAAEIVGGAAALSPAHRSFARWWLTALLAAVFPANLHMAINHDETSGRRFPRWLLWARLPLQGALIGWVWRATR